MKTPLTYGFLSAIAGAVLTLLLYFSGMHDDPEKMATAQWVGGVGGLAIIITVLALAMREKRAGAAPDVEWTYGSAVGTGVMTALFATLFGTIVTYVYFAYINPNITDVILQMQQAKMEANGASQTQIANAEPIMRKMMSPLISSCFQAIFGFVISVVIALVVAIFFRERSANLTPEAPPTLG